MAGRTAFGSIGQGLGYQNAFLPRGGSPSIGAASVPVAAAATSQNTFHGYDFRGHDFPVYAANKYYYSVQNRKVFQYFWPEGHTYDLGTYDPSADDSDDDEIIRHYVNGPDEAGCSRKTKVHVKCGSEAAIIDEVENNCSYDLTLTLPCDQLPADDHDPIMHKEGCPHTSNVKFDDDLFAFQTDAVLRSADGVHTYYLDRNHIIQRDVTKKSDEVGYETDFGYYERTTTQFLEEDRYKRTYQQYLDQYDDKDEYQTTRFYSRGKEGWDAFRKSLMHLKCAPADDLNNRILSVDEVQNAPQDSNYPKETKIFVFRVQIRCDQDETRPDAAGWFYPVCPNNEKCVLKDPNNILGTTCQP